MKMINNTMVQELNDTQLDMVNGAGFFDAAKDMASRLWQTTKDLATIVETASKINSARD